MPTLEYRMTAADASAMANAKSVETEQAKGQKGGSDRLWRSHETPGQHRAQHTSTVFCP